MKSKVLLMSILVLLVATGCGGPPATTPVPTTLPSWAVVQRGNVLAIHYGSGTHMPQYAALHTDSSYFRLIYGPDSGWGTSVVLLPSFWSHGTYFQGAPITTSWRTDANDLVISFSGTVSTLSASGEVRLAPPGPDSASAVVSVTATGTLSVDRRPGEAFKPLMLSSMQVSPSQWDAHSAFVENQVYQIPDGGWIIEPPQPGRRFGLEGGTSNWKTNSPTVTVVLDTERQVSGWVTSTNNPNHDNLGVWPASEEVLPSWKYTIVATRP
jgi:hypothetical protein